MYALFPIDCETLSKILCFFKYTTKANEQEKKWTFMIINNLQTFLVMMFTDDIATSWKRQKCEWIEHFKWIHNNISFGMKPESLNKWTKWERTSDRWMGVNQIYFRFKVANRQLEFTIVIFQITIFGFVYCWCDKRMTSKWKKYLFEHLNLKKKTE